MALINLQNTPKRPGVLSVPVSFQSNGVTLKGILFKPSGSEEMLHCVIVTRSLDNGQRTDGRYICARIGVTRICRLGVRFHRLGRKRRRTTLR